MIPEDKLQPYAWYYGDGRLGPIAKWNGNVFLGINYEWGQDTISTMTYGNKGFSPYHVIDETFTPRVMKAVNTIMDFTSKSFIQNTTSLQDSQVIDEFKKKFMEVETLLLNVETQRELLKLAMQFIAIPGRLSLEETQQLAEATLASLQKLQDQQ